MNWDVETQTLSYIFDRDALKTGSISRDLTNDFFGGSESVHFGWTAATGGISNQHLVKVTAIDAVFDLNGAHTSSLNSAFAIP